ncbi:MAG TPA: hypothetical protein VF669_17115 [Tepidisphaeraceae bacterium]|jgi:Flp pilus assembly protein protease CpaA
MVKLLLCLLSILTLAVVMLQLRQQRLELSHQNNVLHSKIESQQARLWSQQFQIGVATAPNAIKQTVGANLKMVSRTPMPAGQSHWLDVRTNATRTGN